MENEEFAPEIIFGHRRYLCPLDLALEVMGGKWKTMMIYRLRGGALRSSELQRRMAGISNKMFTQAARELERDGLLRRTVYAQVPPRVEYALTARGAALLPVLEQLAGWGATLAEQE